jgi:alpha-1,6-mannosyltransferase
MDKRCVYYVFPGVLFLVLYSFLPHKELRFIFPAILMLNFAAGLGLAKLFRFKQRRLLATVFGCLILGITIMQTCVLSLVSMHNYPGGAAFRTFHSLIRQEQPHTLTTVHIDVPAAMTGVTRFGEIGGEFVVYSKQENLKAFDQFEWLITGDPIEHGKAEAFDIIYTQEAYAGLKIRWASLSVRLEPRIYILRRRNTSASG